MFLYDVNSSQPEAGPPPSAVKRFFASCNDGIGTRTRGAGCAAATAETSQAKKDRDSRDSFSPPRGLICGRK